MNEGRLMSVASLGSYGCSSIASILIARELGVEGRGTWAVVASVAGLVSVVSQVGLPAAAGFAVARADASELRIRVRATLIASVIFSLLAALIFLAISATPLAPVDSKLAVLVLGATLAGGAVMHQVAHQLVLTGGSVRWYVVAQVVPAVATVIAIFVGTFASFGIVYVAAVSSAALALGTSLCLIGLAAHDALGGPPDRSDLTSFGPVLRPFVPFAVATFGTVVLSQVTQRVDLVIVNAYSGAREAGLYAVAVQMRDVLLVVPAALGLLVFTRSARRSPNHWSEVMQTLRITAVVSVLSATTLAIVAPQLVRLVFGADYGGAATPIRLLLPGTVLLALQSVISGYVAGRGRPRGVLVAWAVGAVVLFIGDVIVVPRFGAEGAATVASVTFAVILWLHIDALLTVRHDPPPDDLAPLPETAALL